MKRMDFEKATASPASVYDSPEQVLSDPRLDREGKRTILERWAQDARDLSVAENENMAGGEPSMLHRVLDALRSVSTGSFDPNGVAGDAARAEEVPETVAAIMRETEATLHPDHDPDEARARLRAADLPVMPVADGVEIVGMFGTEDLAALGEEAGPDVPRVTVAHHMTTRLAFCYVDDPPVTASRLMEDDDIDWLLVLDREGHYVGLVSAAAVHAVHGKSAPAPAGTRRARTEQTASRASARTGEGPKSYSVVPKVRRR